MPCRLLGSDGTSLYIRLLSTVIVYVQSLLAYHGSCFEVSNEECDHDERLDTVMLPPLSNWDEDMKRGQGRWSPYILAGAGQSIIDDLSCEESKLLAEQINRNGKKR